MSQGVRAAEALLASGKISEPQFQQLLQKDRLYHQLATPCKNQQLVPYNECEGFSKGEDFSGKGIRLRPSTQTEPSKKRRRKMTEDTKENCLNQTKGNNIHDDKACMDDKEKKEIYNRWGVSYEPPAVGEPAVKAAVPSAAETVPYGTTLTALPSALLQNPLSPLSPDPFIKGQKPRDAFHMLREINATPNRFVKERVFSPPAAVHKVDVEVFKDFQSQLQDAESEITFLRKETEKVERAAQERRRDWMDHLEVETTMDMMLSRLEIDVLREENERLNTTARRCKDEKERCNEEKEEAKQKLRLAVSKCEEEKAEANTCVRNMVRRCDKEKSEVRKQHQVAMRKCEEEKEAANKRMEEALQKCDEEKEEARKAKYSEVKGALETKSKLEEEPKEQSQAPVTMHARAKHVSALGARFDQLHMKYAMSPKAPVASAARTWSLKRPLTPTSIQRQLLSAAEQGAGPDSAVLQALRSKFYEEIQSLRDEMYHQIDGGDRLKTLSDKLVTANDIAKTNRDALILANKKIRAQEGEMRQMQAELKASQVKATGTESSGTHERQATSRELQATKQELAATKQELAAMSDKCHRFGEQLKETMKELLGSRAKQVEAEHQQKGAEVSAREAKKAQEFIERVGLFVAGVPVVKHGRKGKPRRRVVYLRPVGRSYVVTWSDGAQGVGKSEIALSDVTSVLTGLSTAVLQRSGHSQRANQYLSLVTAERSLDLEFESEGQRDKLRQVLDTLLEEEIGACFSKEVSAARTRRAGSMFDSVPGR
jgi:hypothetical protein